MRERNAFRRACTPTGEEKDRLLAIPYFGKVKQTRQQRRRRAQTEQPPADDRRFHRGQELIEVDHFRRPGKIFQSLRDRPRGDDGLQTSLPLRRDNRFAPAGEVQVHRDFPGEHDGHVRDHPAFSRWQDDTDASLRALDFQMSRQRRSHSQEFAAREGRVVHAIDDRRSKCDGASARAGTRAQGALATPGAGCSRFRRALITVRGPSRCPPPRRLTASQMRRRT